MTTAEIFEEISEDTAIKTAYSAIIETADLLESIENDTKCIPKTGTDVIVTDSGKELNTNSRTSEFDKYTINVNDTKEHSISTHKEICDGSTCWIVTVKNISTNRLWDISFSVAINAKDGSIVSVNYTR